MEGVPARKGFMPVLTLALPSLISCAILDTQNDGLHLIGTALPQAAAYIPKHSKEPNLLISPSLLCQPVSTEGGYFCLFFFPS